MTTVESTHTDAAQGGAAGVRWDLSDLLGDESGGDAAAAVDALLDQADDVSLRIAACRGRVATLDADGLAAVMRDEWRLRELVGRADSYAGLWYVTDVTESARGALMQHVTERATEIETRLLFFKLEWAAVDDERAAALLADPGLGFCRHHLLAARRYRRHQLSEPEEQVLSEKSVTGSTAWSRLFQDLTSTISVSLDGREATLEEALSRLASPSREMRAAAASAVTAGLAPGLPTRAFVFNTLLHDKAVDDRLRRYDNWLAERNLDNEASDASVEALVQSVRRRYDIPQRWYALKAKLLGVDRLADYDRMASLSADEEPVGWSEAKAVVLDSYHAFSPELGAAAQEFFDNSWIDAPATPGKRPGAFCAYTVPEVHPYVFLNWTARRSDILVLADELGHACHAWLARPQGPFHQSTPLTLAETASVFGETLVFGRLLDSCETPEARLALLAENIEGAIATIFRQTAMNQFEDLVHRARRDEGELSVDRFGELWARTQAEMLGDAVEITEGYRTWWSYIPHFIDTPGYVYAYAFGQLLALSVYRQYEVQGSDFVARYLRLLSSGGSDTPEALAMIVGCDLGDGAFWDGGLALVEAQLNAAEQVAFELGRL